MEWTVIFDDDFDAWFIQQEVSLQDAILTHAKLLQQFGPNLHRPYVDNVKGSKLPNLKELRVQHQGEPWRILFAFDPKRQAFLLVGGSKQGNDRWYKKAIPLAEKRYRRHLEEMEK